MYICVFFISYIHWQFQYSLIAFPNNIPNRLRSRILLTVSEPDQPSCRGLSKKQSFNLEHNTFHCV